MVGVLALQGGVAEHLSILGKLGLETRQVRCGRDLDGLSALILPGGESRTLLSLMERWEIAEKLRIMGLEGFPIFGTCAGAVLLSRQVDEREHRINQSSLGLADVKAIRNYFGRQTKSFIQSLRVEGLDIPFRAIFIRAPLLEPLSGDVEVLSSVDDGPVLMRQGNIWLSSFHPELTSDGRIHSLFLSGTGVIQEADHAHI